MYCVPFWKEKMCLPYFLKSGLARWFSGHRCLLPCLVMGVRGKNWLPGAVLWVLLAQCHGTYTCGQINKHKTEIKPNECAHPVLSNFPWALSHQLPSLCPSRSIIPLSWGHEQRLQSATYISLRVLEVLLEDWPLSSPSWGMASIEQAPE